MKFSIKHIGLFALLVYLFAACTEIPPEIPQLNIDGDKAVLIEDFTGVKCTNCPTAATEINNLVIQYGENVIPVSIHAPKYSSFTSPHLNSKYDFRLDKADAIANLVEQEIMGLPAAMFDRFNFNLPGLDGHVVSSTNNYGKALEERLKVEAELLLTVENKYDSDTRKLTSTAHIRPVKDIDGEVYITFMLLENGIVDYQTDKQEIIEEYVHNYVLRDIYSQAATGDLISQPLNRNELIEIRRTVDILPPEEGKEWNNPENMHTVVVVHRKDQLLTCLQAAKASLMD